VNEKFTVCIIDDDDDFRKSLAWLLERHKFNVRQFSSAAVFLEEEPLETGCIVTDVRMPGMDGLELQKELADRKINLPVIVITGYGDIEMAVEAMRNGAFDFIEKPFDDKEFIEIINKAQKRETAEHKERQIAQEVSERIASLSTREREVMERVVRGKPNKVIAAEFFLSPRTVEIHRANMMRKMKVGSVAELVRMTCLVERYV
jgi:two-component system response regulator FixJ